MKCLDFSFKRVAGFFSERLYLILLLGMVSILSLSACSHNFVTMRADWSRECLERANILMDEKKYKEASEQYDCAVSNLKAAFSYYRYCNDCVRDTGFDETVPIHLSLYRAKQAACLLYLGEMKSSKKLLDESLLLNNSNAYAHLVLGVWHLERSDTRSARREVEILEGLDKDQAKALQVAINLQEAKNIKTGSSSKSKSALSADAKIKNKEAGEAFLTENKKKEGVVTLPSGLQYKMIRSGKGRSPTSADTVEVHYLGTLIDGTEFDSSYKRGQTVTFPVNGVIRGWTEALQRMKVGDKWKLFVPSELAYGERRAGDQIGPNATLIFELELVSIK